MAFRAAAIRIFWTRWGKETFLIERLGSRRMRKPETMLERRCQSQ